MRILEQVTDDKDDEDDDPENHKREFFVDNLLVRIHFIILMIRWTGLAPWESEFAMFSRSRRSRGRRRTT